MKIRFKTTLCFKILSENVLKTWFQVHKFSKVLVHTLNGFRADIETCMCHFVWINQSCTLKRHYQENKLSSHWKLIALWMNAFFFFLFFVPYWRELTIHFPHSETITEQRSVKIMESFSQVSHVLWYCLDYINGKFILDFILVEDFCSFSSYCWSLSAEREYIEIYACLLSKKDFYNHVNKRAWLMYEGNSVWALVTMATVICKIGLWTEFPKWLLEKWSREMRSIFKLGWKLIWIIIGLTTL